MFARHGIAYRSVDLDSVEYQAGNRGGEIRAALSARTRVNTIPQIFVGGEFIGGCTDVFDAHKAGRLQALLDKHRVAYDRDVRVDAYSFLPSWLHPR
jgi:cysteine synthase A